MDDHLSSIVSNHLNSGFRDFNRNLRHIMKEKGIKYEDIKMYLDDIDESKFNQLLQVFGMNYTFENVTQKEERFITVVLNIPADILLCTLGQAEDLDAAKNEALKKMYDIFIVYLRKEK